MLPFIEYRSFCDLSSVLLKNLHRFPHDAETVVGIPRSGMLPAALIALFLNKPLSDLDSFVVGRTFKGGHRSKTINRIKTGRIIVIDDSVSSGKSILEAKEKLGNLSNEFDFIYAAVYVASEGRKYVDLFCEIINGPRIFQWNIFHEPNLLKRTCMDIDGVLCPNPTVDDDGDQYLEHVTNARPYIIPTVSVNTLVSCRLEKYRKQTEAWLQKYDIKYQKLILLNLPSKEERVKWAQHGEWKAQIFKQSSCNLFIESSKSEAIKICNVSGKQVFCVDTLEMLYGGHQYINKTITKTAAKICLLIKAILPIQMQQFIKKIINK